MPVQLPVDCLDKQPFEGPGIPDKTGKGSGCRMLEVPTSTLWDPCIYGVCTIDCLPTIHFRVLLMEEITTWHVEKPVNNGIN